jgi:hypothetical protein
VHLFYILQKRTRTSRNGRGLARGRARRAIAPCSSGTSRRVMRSRSGKSPPRISLNSAVILYKMLMQDLSRHATKS